MDGERVDASTLVRMVENPLRARLFFEYLRGPTSPSRAARKLRAPLNLVAYHTQALAKRGCVEPSRVERRRGATERFFTAAFIPFIEDDDWAALPRKLRRGLSRATLHVITQDAWRAVLHGGFDNPRAHLSLTPVQVDADGADAVAALLRTLMDDIQQIQRESSERGGDSERMELGVLFFESLNPSVRG